MLAELLSSTPRATPDESDPHDVTPERDDAVPIGDWSEGLRDAQDAAQRVMALEDDVAR